MDTLVSGSALPKKPSFFKKVFEINTKSDVLNICQYCLVIVIPLVILTRNINFFFPKLGHMSLNYLNFLF